MKTLEGPHPRMLGCICNLLNFARPTCALSHQEIQMKTEHQKLSITANQLCVESLTPCCLRVILPPKESLTDIIKLSPSCYQSTWAPFEIFSRDGTTSQSDFNIIMLITNVFIFRQHLFHIWETRQTVYKLGQVMDAKKKKRYCNNLLWISTLTVRRKLGSNYTSISFSFFFTALLFKTWEVLE